MLPAITQNLQVGHPRILLQHTQYPRLDLAIKLPYTQPGLDVVAMRIHVDDADQLH